MANHNSSNGPFFRWWKHAPSPLEIAEITKFQEEHQLTERTAKLFYAAAVKYRDTYGYSMEDRWDVVGSGGVILILAEKLAAEVHKKWIASMKQPGIDFLNSTKAKADSESTLKQMIQRLKVSDLMRAVADGREELKARPESSPLTGYLVRYWARGIFRYLENVNHFVNVKFYINTTEVESFELAVFGVRLNMRYASNFRKKDLGKLLADHLDKGWRADWRESPVDTRVKVNSKFGVALVKAVWKLIGMLLKDEKLVLRVPEMPETVTPTQPEGASNQLCRECRGNLESDTTYTHTQSPRCETGSPEGTSVPIIDDPMLSEWALIEEEGDIGLEI
ncbi:hypothetical protein JCM33374_g5320 [Metschnikowia sp. JCM 33374]|nr:hypothetical protein JCM33374_g5320 [Metschnikowia sp. JCM 33374]